MLRCMRNRSVRQPPRPGGAKRREQIAIYAIVSGNSPRQNQEDGKRPDNGVDAHGTGQHEVQVHEDAEEGRNTSKYSEDESQSNQKFAEGDNVGEPSRIRQDKALQERSIPALHGRMGSSRLSQRALHKALQRRPGMGIEYPRSTLHRRTKGR